MRTERVVSFSFDSCDSVVVVVALKLGASLAVNVVNCVTVVLSVAFGVVVSSVVVVGAKNESPCKKLNNL